MHQIQIKAVEANLMGELSGAYRFLLTVNAP
ncbi:Uncharacterised protein [Vibrio cholerae]|nr:Uncharacterised protein [Vibrio cholerae]